MYEFNGWVVIKESRSRALDVDEFRRRAGERVKQLSDFRWTASRIEVVDVGQQPCLLLTGLFNRNRGESGRIHELLESVGREFPGSYGLLYELTDEQDLPSPPGELAFHVHVLEKGVLRFRLDPFLSPTRPVLED